MILRFRQILGSPLPLAALLSLVVGPSPSAASAEFRQRLAAEEAARDRASDPSQTGHAAHGAFQSQPQDKDQREEADQSSAFVAPTSMKPAETERTSQEFTITGLETYAPSRRGLSESRHSETSAKPRKQRRPAYQANAPPRG